MKRTLILIVVLTLVLSAGSAFAQQRLPQKEIFIGGAVPLAPDGFKDYYKTGLSIHGQYVVFPMNNVGISFGAAFEYFLFDGDKWLEDWGYDNMGYSVDGYLTVVELGVGVRPYLTPATANSQIFLFGMPTINIISDKKTLKDEIYDDEEEFTEDDTNFGIAIGGGIEMPAGNVNIIIQGVYRSIFSYQPDEDYDAEDISFFGITAGIVF